MSSIENNLTTKTTTTTTSTTTTTTTNETPLKTLEINDKQAHQMKTDNSNEPRTCPCGKTVALVPSNWCPKCELYVTPDVWSDCHRCRMVCIVFLFIVLISLILFYIF